MIWITIFVAVLFAAMWASLKQREWREVRVRDRTVYKHVSFFWNDHAENSLSLKNRTWAEAIEFAESIGWRQFNVFNPRTWENHAIAWGVGHAQPE